MQKWAVLRAAAPEGLRKDSGALEICEELVQLDPREECNNSEEVVELILPEDKVCKITVILRVRIAICDIVRVDDRVFDHFENDDGHGKNEVEKLSSKCKMFEKSAQTKNFHFVDLFAKIVSDENEPKNLANDCCYIKSTRVTVHMYRAELSFIRLSKVLFIFWDYEKALKFETCS